MTTISVTVMLSRMNLIDEAVVVVVTNNSQGIITVDYFSQLNEKYVEGICRFLRRHGGTTGGVSNPGVAVQVMIYYIKTFNRIRRTCTHANVDIDKVYATYHQWDMEEAHNNPEVVPNVNPKYWPKNL